jgi:hypothetical protein
MEEYERHFLPLFEAILMSIAPFTCFIKVALPHQLTKWDDYWLQIHGYWMTLAKKINSPGHFQLPLDLVVVRGGESETNIQNSLFIETSQESGSHRLYISSTSRIETIQLFQALNVGFNFFKSSFQAGKRQERTECEYHVSSGFMNLSKGKRKLVLTREGLIVSDSKQYPLSTIISMSGKQNDQACGTKLVVTIKGPDDSLQQKEFAVISPTEMMRMCSSFLMHAKALAAERRATR